jgi:hypothetical protein
VYTVRSNEVGLTPTAANFGYVELISARRGSDSDIDIDEDLSEEREKMEEEEDWEETEEEEE